MPVKIYEQVHYRTAEVCQMAGINKMHSIALIRQLQEYRFNNEDN
jgi:hypothetical protein